MEVEPGTEIGPINLQRKPGTKSHMYPSCTPWNSQIRTHLWLPTELVRFWMLKFGSVCYFRIISSINLQWLRKLWLTIIAGSEIRPRLIKNSTCSWDELPAKSTQGTNCGVRMEWKFQSFKRNFEMGAAARNWERRWWGKPEALQPLKLNLHKAKTFNRSNFF